MTEPLAEYADRMSEYEKARDKAVQMIQAVEKIGTSMRYSLPEFLTQSYGLHLPGMRASGSRGHRYDMEEWPNAITLRTVLTEWHAALMRLREAWAAVPEDRRSAMKPPPQTLSAG